MTPLAAALLLSLVHLGAGLLDFLHTRPRSAFLSFASGVSIAFVFIDLLPELAAGQRVVAQSETDAFAFLERHVYLLALLGLCVFYGLERMVLSARRPSRALADGSAGGGMYWLHISAFALYNALVGYLLVHRVEEGERHPTLLSLALALHFLVNDLGLREHYKRHYGGAGRWILVAAPLLGLAAGYGSTLSDVALAVLYAFLAGGIILNTLKEELPEDRQARFWAFALGVVVYATMVSLA